MRRSIDEPEWFWDSIVRWLEIRFDQPYEDVLDTSSGIPWAKWFVGGRLNIAATCIDATAKFQEQRGDFTRAISGVFPQIACFALANKVAADAIVGTLNELKKNGTYDKLLDQYGVLKIDEATFSIKGPGPA